MQVQVAQLGHVARRDLQPPAANRDSLRAGVPTRIFNPERLEKVFLGKVAWVHACSLEQDGVQQV